MFGLLESGYPLLSIRRADAEPTGIIGATSRPASRLSLSEHRSAVRGTTRPARGPRRRTAAFAADLVIFDCDGVLVDSEQLQAAVLVEVLEDHGVSSGMIGDAMRFRGGKLADVIALVEKEIGRSLHSGIVGEIRARTHAAFEKELRPVEGVAALLGQMTTPYCVASNGPRDKMMVTLRCCGLLHLFEERIFSAYEVGRWKPAPDLFLHAAGAMGVEAGRTVVVEDSPLGVQAGVAAGMKVLAFAPPERAGELVAAGAAHVFWPMAALRELLGIRGA